MLTMQIKNRVAVLMQREIRDGSAGCSASARRLIQFSLVVRLVDQHGSLSFGLGFRYRLVGLFGKGL